MTAVPARSAPLFGRAGEMAVLTAALENALAGRSRVILVGGEAGIGKTRLAEELAEAAANRGARVLWGRCWEAGGAPAYWPWIQVVRAAIRDMPPPAVAELLGPRAPDLARLLPELREALPDPSLATAPDDSDARFRMFEAQSVLLDALTRDAPIVVILDDLHAADEPSLLLLRFVASEVQQARLLVLALYRDDELDPADPRNDALVDLARIPGSARLTPTPLGLTEISAYLDAYTPQRAGTTLAETIYAQTEGNPLFVGEVIRLLHDGTPEWVDDQGFGMGLGVSEGIRSVIGRRLAGVSPSCRALLESASVFGPEVRLDRLAALVDRPIEGLLADVDEAIAIRALVERGPGTNLRFGHAMIREVLYASLPSATKVALHRRIGLLLEDLDAADPPLAELAYHFSAAADRSKSVQYARRAAEAAEEAAAHEEAMRLYRLALGVAGTGAEERLDLLLALGGVANRAGDEPAARGAFLEAANAARRLGRPSDVARAAIGYGGRSLWRRPGDDHHLIPLVEEALMALDSGDSPSRALLLARLAGAVRDEPSLLRRADLSREAVAMARRLGDPVILGMTLISRIIAVAAPDAIPEMERDLREARQLAEEAGDAELLGDTQVTNLFIAQGVGDGARLRQVLTEAERLSRTLRHPSHHWYRALFDASMAILEGRLADADGLLPANRRKGDLPQQWDADAAYRSQLFLLRREQDRLAEVASLIRESTTRFPGYRHFEAADVYIAAASGRTVDAQRRLQAFARDNFEWFPRDFGWLFALSFLAEAAILLGDRDAAGRAEVLLKPYRTLVGTASGDGSSGPVARILGLLAADGGRLDEATTLLEDAMEIAIRMGSPLWEARIRLEQADVRGRRDAGDDREKAVDLVAEALENARQLGLIAIEHQAAVVVQRLEDVTSVPKSSAPGSAPSPTAASPGLAGIWQREGDDWLVGFDRPIRLRDAKGLHYLARLLAEPGREFHALDLLTSTMPAPGPGAIPASAAAAVEGGLTISPGGRSADGDELIDTEARDAYRVRLRELSAELEEARAFNDPGRAERAEGEIDALETELARAFGLGGRARRQTAGPERARQSVSKAIRETLARIEKRDEVLYGHLSRSVRTGTFCVYDPDPAAVATWKVVTG